MHRAVFERAPVGLGIWDRELRYRALNARLAEINGIPQAEHLGHTPSEGLGPVSSGSRSRRPCGA